MSYIFKTRTEFHQPVARSKLMKDRDIRYLPPEFIEDFIDGKSQDRSLAALKSADIWAAGVILYRLLTLEFPIKAKKVSDITDQLLLSSDPVNLELIENIEVRQLLSKMLEKSPEKRFTILDAAQSPWLTRNNGEPINLDLSTLSSYASR